MSVRLWLDDVRDPAESGRRGWTWVRTVEEAKALLLEGGVERASLDHDLGGTHRDPETGKTIYPEGMSAAGSGHDLVLWMEEEGIWPGRVDVHTASDRGAERMLEVVRRYRPGAKWTSHRGGVRRHPLNRTGGA